MTAVVSDPDLWGPEKAEWERAAAQPEPSKTPFIDWASFLNVDHGSVEFLPGKLLTKGAQGALVGDGKVGKSLLAFDWAWHCATGRAFLGDKPHEPLRVLYVDKENSWIDIQTRAHSLGCTAEELANVRYLSFPGMPPLDTEQGGDRLVEYARLADANVVILDTVSRMISGKENESDTWLNLYNHTLVRLKSCEISSLRLDHFGKDDAKGARGSSAKTQDVDVVWELSVDGTVKPGHTPLKLFRTHTRAGIGPDAIELVRTGSMTTDEEGNEAWAPGGTGHTVRDREVNEWQVPRALARKADELGVPPLAGREAIKKAVMGANPDLRYAEGVWAKAATLRKALDWNASAAI